MHSANVIFHYFKNFSAEQKQQIDRLGELYKHWNSQINVISRKDIDNIYVHHVLHSLAISRWIQFPADSLVLDFGTGGGFPGIPLAIAFPKVQFHLVDSIGKKIKVVKAIADELGLRNVRASHARVEELDLSFDFITCRAVAPLAQIVGWTKHLLRKKIEHEHAGTWILLKGGNLDEEIKEANRLTVTFPLSNYFNEPFFDDKYIVNMK